MYVITNTTYEYLFRVNGVPYTLKSKKIYKDVNEIKNYYRKKIKNVNFSRAPIDNINHKKATSLYFYTKKYKLVIELHPKQLEIGPDIDRYYSIFTTEDIKEPLKFFDAFDDLWK
jgi:hypothetical protein